MLIDVLRFFTRAQLQTLQLTSRYVCRTVDEHLGQWPGVAILGLRVSILHAVAEDQAHSSSSLGWLALVRFVVKRKPEKFDWKKIPIPKGFKF